MDLIQILTVFAHILCLAVGLVLMFEGVASFTEGRMTLRAFLRWQWTGLSLTIVNSIFLRLNFDIMFAHQGIGLVVGSVIGHLAICSAGLFMFWSGLGALVQGTLRFDRALVMAGCGALVLLAGIIGILVFVPIIIAQPPVAQ